MQSRRDEKKRASQNEVPSVLYIVQKYTLNLNFNCTISCLWNSTKNVFQS